MWISRIKTIGLVAVAAVGLSACYGNDYGYGGVSVGYGVAGAYGPGYASGFGDPYWGWHDGFYYPGSGYFVYDSYRRPYRWNGAQRSYWEARRGGWRGDRREIRENWRDFTRDRRQDERAFRRDRRDDRADFRRGAVSRPEFRAERRQDRREFRREYRQDRRALRRENRRDRRD
ncbi:MULTISPECIES: hypothetical protein [unclassified Sphingomonas]|jgi:hypothetical protein|uniref:hypothetical protein n=1 Tax=unclassified Sphingomonas TaxID=196159 RepID=UPI000AEA36D6|nr:MULTISPECIES: hypothetical protein [unclassified Sphingomonas]